MRRKHITRCPKCDDYASWCDEELCRETENHARNEPCESCQEENQGERHDKLCRECLAPEQCRDPNCSENDDHRSAELCVYCQPEAEEENATSTINKIIVRGNAFSQLIKEALAPFRQALENDEPIDGSEAVDALVTLNAKYNTLLCQRS